MSTYLKVRTSLKILNSYNKNCCPLTAVIREVITINNPYQFSLYNQNTRKVLYWNLLYCFSIGMHTVLFNLYLRALSLDSILIGKISAIGFIVQALIFIPAGMLGDKLGTKRALLIGIAFLSVGFWLRSFAEVESWLITWTVIASIGMAMLNVTFIPILTDYSSEQERVSLFGTAFATGTFATFIGTLLGGVLTDLFDYHLGFTELASLRITLSLAGLVGTLCLIPILLLARHKQTSLNQTKKRIWLLVKEDSAFLKLMSYIGVSKFLMGMGIGLTIPFINLFLADRFDAPKTIISMIIAIATFGTVLAMTQNTKIVKSVGEIKAVIYIQLVALPFVLLMGLSTNIYLACFCFILFRTFKYASGPIESSIIMAKVDPAIKGLANSIGWMALTIGTGITGPVCMYLVSHYGFYWGYNITFFISALVSIAATILFYKAFQESVSPSIALKESHSS